MKHPMEKIDPYLSCCLADMADKLPKIPTSVSLFDNVGRRVGHAEGQAPLEWSYHAGVMQECSDWGNARVYWVKNRSWVANTAPTPWTIGFSKNPKSDEYIESQILNLSQVPGWVRAMLFVTQRGERPLYYENTLIRLVDKVTQLHWSQGRVMMEAFDTLAAKPYDDIHSRLVMNVKSAQAQKAADHHHFEYPEEEQE